MSTKNSSSKNEEKSSDSFKYEILSHIGILSQNQSGWSKEVNVVKWNDANPKIDIRDWDNEHEKMSRGISLNLAEAEKLSDMLFEIDFKEMLI